MAMSICAGTAHLNITPQLSSDFAAQLTRQLASVLPTVKIPVSASLGDQRGAGRLGVLVPSLLAMPPLVSDGLCRALAASATYLLAPLAAGARTLNPKEST